MRARCAEIRNIQHPTSNIQHPTFNIQHSTFNIQHSNHNSYQQQVSSARVLPTKGWVTLQRRAISASDHCRHWSSLSNVNRAFRLSAFVRRRPCSALVPQAKSIAVSLGAQPYVRKDGLKRIDRWCEKRFSYRPLRWVRCESYKKRLVTPLFRGVDSSLGGRKIFRTIGGGTNMVWHF